MLVLRSALAFSFTVSVSFTSDSVAVVVVSDELVVDASLCESGLSVGFTVLPSSVLSEGFTTWLVSGLLVGVTGFSALEASLWQFQFFWF